MCLGSLTHAPSPYQRSLHTDTPRSIAFRNPTQPLATTGRTCGVESCQRNTTTLVRAFVCLCIVCVWSAYELLGSLLINYLIRTGRPTEFPLVTDHMNRCSAQANILHNCKYNTQSTNASLQNELNALDLEPRTKRVCIAGVPGEKWHVSHVTLVQGASAFTCSIWLWCSRPAHFFFPHEISQCHPSRATNFFVVVIVIAAMTTTKILININELRDSNCSSWLLIGTRAYDLQSELSL